MRQRLRELLGPAAFEAAFVVFGVVVAYAVNEWRETRLHRQDAAAARAAIVREMATNREAVAASAVYHAGLLHALDSVRANGGQSSIRLFSRGFTMPAQLSYTAWEVAEQTGVLNHMPMAEVLRFSRVYAEQRRYDDAVRLAGSVIYSELYHTGAPEMGRRGHQLASLISSQMYRERALLAAYEGILSPDGTRTPTVPGAVPIVPASHRR